MSTIESFLLTKSNSLPSEIKNVSAQLIQTLTDQALSNRTFWDKSADVPKDILNTTSIDSFSTDRSIISKTKELISESVEDTLDKSKLTILSDISTTTNNIIKTSVPEVTLSKPEVLEDSGLGTAEHVVIGACILVVFLACVAIILRIVMPYIRPKLKQKKDLLDKLDEKSSGSSGGFTNFGTETDSHSSGSESNPSQDWSEVSSDQTRSTDADEKPEDMARHYGQLRRHPNLDEDFRGSSSSLPTYLPAKKEIVSKSNKSSPMPARRLNDDLVSVISTHSLEPLHMEDSYRNRWDDQWDPYCSLPRGNLSHHSHPSESRLSLSSKSTTSVQSNARFPTPSREQVHKIQLDKERRYPSKPHEEPRKEKNVRMLMPNNR